MDNKPIYDVEAEKSLIKELIQMPKSYYKIIDIIGKEIFWKIENQNIYEAIESLKKQEIEVDMLTIKAEMQKSGTYKDDIINYILDLLVNAQMPINVIVLARYLYELYLRRETITSAYKTVKDSQNMAIDVFDTISKMQNKNIELVRKIIKKDITEPKNITNQLEKLLIEFSNNDIKAIPTPNWKINRNLNGGIKNGELMVIAGRPSDGKTSYVINWINHISKAYKIGFYSIEQSERQITMRLLINKIGIDIWKIQYKTSEYDAQIGLGIEDLKKSNIYINSKARWEIDKLQLDIKTNILKYGWNIIFIDYLQLIRAKGNSESRAKELGLIIEDLKAIAKENEIPVVCIAQLSRETDKRSKQRPQSSDIKESGYIEETADVILALYNPSEKGIDTFPDGTDTKGKCEIIMLKNREGAKGSEIVEYDKRLFRFTSITYIPEPKIDEVPF